MGRLAQTLGVRTYSDVDQRDIYASYFRTNSHLQGDTMDLIDPSSWNWAQLTDPAIANAKELVSSKIKDGVDIALEKVKEKWTELKWPKAAASYQCNLRDNLSKTKVLGNPKSIEIEKIYTDVYVHDTPSAHRRFSGDVAALSKSIFEDLLKHDRLSAVDAAKTGSDLFILGRPGAGKTTFLKYLAILCCKGEIKKTPIFIALKDWSDSGLELLPYVASTFDVCGFPAAEPFVRALLERGDALVLLDGLDEVGDSQSKRQQTIKDVVKLAKKYRKCQYCLTCRTAATDYSFDDFTYLEVADFTNEQQLAFVRQWYGVDIKRLKRFLDGWNEAEREGLRELGKTPLLLTLLCLAFDETLQFPQRHVDLYQDAIDALLRKWDTSRLVVRDPFYKNLSHSRRENLLESVAAKFYLDGRVAFNRNELEPAILEYLGGLPDKEQSGRADASTVIRQIEAQHGLLVERASGVYSFSHLTIKEYFTASHIVKMQEPNILNQVAAQACRDPKWREVMLFTIGLMPRADALLDILVNQLAELRGNEPGVLNFLTVILCDVTISSFRSLPRKDKGHRALLFGRHPAVETKKAIIAHIRKDRRPALTSAELSSVRDHLVRIRDFLIQKESRYNFGIASQIVRQCTSLIENKPGDAAQLLGGYFARPDNFIAYLYGCRLLIECLEVGVTKHRDRFLTHILSVDESAVAIVRKQLGQLPNNNR